MAHEKRSTTGFTGTSCDRSRHDLDTAHTAEFTDNPTLRLKSFCESGPSNTPPRTPSFSSMGRYVFGYHSSDDTPDFDTRNGESGANL